MFWQLSQDAFGLTFNASMRIIRRKNVPHYGVGNRCSDGKYVLFIDYDHQLLDWIQEEIRLLQSTYRYQLGTAYLFRTKNGYHVIFLEKHDIGFITRALSMTTADHNYKTIPLLYGRKIWVLRQSRKKNEHIDSIGYFPNPFHKLLVREHITLPERSKAHKHYLKLLYSLPKEWFVQGGEFDKETELHIGYYAISEHNN